MVFDGFLEFLLFNPLPHRFRPLFAPNISIPHTQTEIMPMLYRAWNRNRRRRTPRALWYWWIFFFLCRWVSQVGVCYFPFDAICYFVVVWRYERCRIWCGGGWWRHTLDIRHDSANVLSAIYQYSAPAAANKKKCCLLLQNTLQMCTLKWPVWWVKNARFARVCVWEIHIEAECEAHECVRFIVYWHWHILEYLFISIFTFRFAYCWIFGL